MFIIMDREEKIEFLQLYFGRDKLHTDFDILQKAHDILPSLPPDSEKSTILRMITSLLAKRGLFANLKHVTSEHFAEVKNSFSQLFPQVLISFYANYDSFTQKKPFSEVYKEAASACGYPEQGEPHTQMLLLTDYIFLFGAKSREDIDRILHYPEEPAAMSRFHTAIDCLLLEKKYVSVRNFKLIHINSFAAESFLTESARKTLAFLTGKLSPQYEKLYLFLITLLLLERSTESDILLSEAAEFISASYRMLSPQLDSLKLILKKAGIETSPFDTLDTYTDSEESNV